MRKPPRAPSCVRFPTVSSKSNSRSSLKKAIAQSSKRSKSLSAKFAHPDLSRPRSNVQNCRASTLLRARRGERSTFLHNFDGSRTRPKDVIGCRNFPLDRRAYRLTPRGRRILLQEIERMKHLTKLARLRIATREA